MSETTAFRTSKKINVIANYAGQFWMSLMGFIFAPLYVKYLGIEVFGLVGFTASITGLFTALDAGLNAAVLRETARSAGDIRTQGDVIRTLEWVYWPVAVVSGALCMAAAPLVSTYWLKPGELPAGVISNAIIIAGLILLFRWPFSLYSAAMRGRDKQVELNGLMIVCAGLRAVGAVLVLRQVAATAEAFLLWLAGVELLQTLGAAFLCRSGLRRPLRFRRDILQSIKGFALGVSLAGVVYVLINQLDRLTLSKMLDLKLFGYYVFAQTAAGALRGLVYPITTALSPHLAALAARDHAAFARLYHQASQLVSVLLAATVATAALFSREIIFAWSGNAALTMNTAGLFAALVIGMGISSLGQTPAAAQMAYGWSSLLLVMNIGSLALLLPLLVGLASAYGPMGAAWAWIAVNTLGLVIVVPAMHSRILRSEQRDWWVSDVAAPVLAGTAVAGVMRLLAPVTVSRLWGLVFVGIAWTLSLAAAALSAGHVRTPAREYARRYFGAKIGSSPRWRK